MLAQRFSTNVIDTLAISVGMLLAVPFFLVIASPFLGAM